MGQDDQLMRFIFAKLRRKPIQIHDILDSGYTLYIGALEVDEKTCKDSGKKEDSNFAKGVQPKKED